MKLGSILFEANTVKIFLNKKKRKHQRKKMNKIRHILKLTEYLIENIIFYGQMNL